MKEGSYPWPGNFYTGNSLSPVAIVTLAEDIDFDQEKVAIWGPLRTENLGIERVIANTIYNPNIRYLLICGDEIRGHKSGSSLMALSDNGIDENGRIIDSPGALPYIENITREAIERFQNQIETVDLIGITSKDEIEGVVEKYIKKDPEPFRDSYLAIKIKKKVRSTIKSNIALHSFINISVWGCISDSKQEVG